MNIEEHGHILETDTVVRDWLAGAQEVAGMAASQIFDSTKENMLQSLSGKGLSANSDWGLSDLQGPARRTILDESRVPAVNTS